jgi:hypothetical protein
MNPAFLRRSEEAILDLSAKHSPLIAGYDCPAGSAIFFTENLCQCVPSPLIGSTLAQCCRRRRRRRVGTGLLGGAANPVLVACSVGPPWQADHPRVSILHAYSHLAVNFRKLQARLDRDTLAGLPLEKLAYFRPPFTSERHSMQDFLENPDMSWAHEGVGKARGGEGQGVAAELLSIEAMVQRGFLKPAEGEAAKQKVLDVVGRPKL